MSSVSTEALATAQKQPYTTDYNSEELQAQGRKGQVTITPVNVNNALNPAGDDHTDSTPDDRPVNSYTLSETNNAPLQSTQGAMTGGDVLGMFSTEGEQCHSSVISGISEAEEDKIRLVMERFAQQRLVSPETGNRDDSIPLQSPNMDEFNGIKLNSIAGTNGNLGHRVDLQNGAKLSFVTHTHLENESEPNLMGVRQSSFSTQPDFDTSDLDKSESQHISLTENIGNAFAIARDAGLHIETEANVINLEAYFLGATNFIAGVAPDKAPDLTGDGYTPAEDEYVVVTVKTPNKGTYSQVWLLQADECARFGSTSDKELKVFSFNPPNEKEEGDCKSTTEGSIYDSPENVITLKITRLHGITLPARKDDVVDGISFSDEPSISRGVAEAGSASFGTSHERSTEVDLIIPGRSSYIQITSFQIAPNS
ncbi:hypothetical protein [uncultured Endozoicomonas sp.]|uniref:hypothetical protein n=1 Tax=uncultured Endozoicomonas sp. TaxID=432652 RepID=UPI0026226A8F|nr:hypothetical protein [uncultured Endozoicomonas sp.]